MAAPKIFISHSAKLEAEQNLLWALHNRLDEQGFEVLLDVARLKEDPGGPWRVNLNTWIEICDGAILVFNDRAETCSDWVFFESAILKFRRDNDANFPLIPLVIPPAKPESLSTGRFEPHNISSHQAVMADRPDCIDQILSRLENIKKRLETFEQNTENDLERSLCTLLHDVMDDKAIIAAALDLGFNLTKWQPRLERRQVLARLLLQADLVKACETIRKHLTNLPRSQLAIIREYLAPTWVSFQAASSIQEISRGKSEDRCIAVNTEMTRTLKMYLRRASGLLPDRCWKHFEITPPMTTHLIEHVVHEVMTGLDRELNADEFADPLSESEIDEFLNDVSTDEPVFALINFQGQEPLKQDLEEARKRMKAITFVIAVGSNPSTTGSQPQSGAYLLEPVLDTEAENAAMHSYTTSRWKI